MSADAALRSPLCQLSPQRALSSFVLPFLEWSHYHATDNLHDLGGSSIRLVKGKRVVGAAEGAAILIAGLVEILNAGMAEGMPA